MSSDINKTTILTHHIYTLKIDFSKYISTYIYIYVCFNLYGSKYIKRSDVFIYYKIFAKEKKTAGYTSLLA